MNSEHAKEVLLLFRPNSPDSSDPEFIEALDQVGRDTELKRWFEEHCARQSLIRDRLRQIDVPVHLEQEILGEIIQLGPVIWWRRPLIQSLAAAAAVVLLIATAYLWTRPNKSNSFAAYRNHMVRTAQRMYVMDMATNNLTEIRKYLADRHAQADYTLPPALETLPADGCAIMSWRKKTASLVCFDLGKRNDLYLFIVNRADLPDPPTTGQPQFARIGKFISASWSRGDEAYILAGRGDEEFLRKYLP